MKPRRGVGGLFAFYRTCGRREMTRGKKYSAEDVERGLAALAVNGSSEIASEQTGIPASTLRTWKLRQPDEFDELRREKRTPLIEELWAGARDAIARIRDQIKEASAKDAAVILGILVEKALLAGGEPTEITSQLPQIVYRGVDDSEYEEREQG